MRLLESCTERRRDGSRRSSGRAFQAIGPRRRTPDGRACDDVVVRQDGGGWKIEVADDWQRPMWGGSSSRGIGEPCLGDTGELSLRAYGGFAGEHRAVQYILLYS